jgi:signal peptidase I
MISEQENWGRLHWRHLKGEQMKEENREENREENKDVAQALDDIFGDDFEKKNREKEIAKYEKKRQKALEKQEKKSKASQTDSAKGDLQKATSAGDVTSSAAEDLTAGSDTSDKAVSSKEGVSERELKRQSKAEKKAAKKKAKEEKEVNIVKDLLFLCVYIVIVVGICWAVLTFVGQRTEVSGESMSNTLHSGDTLWIDKISYEIGEPERYDVIVFPYGDDGETFYIKRIIGLPGETVYIDEYGRIYINDELLEDDVYGREVIASDKRGVASEDVVLGEDEYFVLGDNRNNSRDSRVADVGNIHRDDIIGKAVFRFTGGFGKIE